MMLRFLFLLVTLGIAHGRTMTNYPGDWIFQDIDQSLRVNAGTDEVGGSIGWQFGLSSALFGDWAAGGTFNSYVLMFKYNSSNLYERTQKITGKGGATLTMSNNTLFIGGTTNTFVFENQNDVWTQVQSLPINSNCADVNYLSCDTLSISKDGEWIIIGYPTESSNKGLIRIYRRNGDTWANTPTFQQNPDSQAGLTGSRYGDAVCMSGNGNFSAACMVGAQGSGTPNNLDQCRIFKRNGDTWNHYDTVTKAADADVGTTATSDDNYADFGQSCAFSDDGETFFVMHPISDPSATGSRIYVFERDHNTETFEKSQVLPELGNGNDFGFKMRFDSGRLFVATPLEQTPSYVGDTGNWGGKIAIFYNIGNGWVPQEGHFLAASSPTAGDRCGTSFGVYNDRVIAGCRYWDEIGTTMSTATVAGRLVSWENIPAYPTPSPTQSPTTPAPTPSPYVEVGKAKINFNVADPVKRKNVAKTTVTDVKNSYANPSDLLIGIKTVETAAVSNALYLQINNETKFKESYAAARGCQPGQCTVLVNGGRRMLTRGRDLQQEITVSIEFTFSEEDYASFTDLNTTLDDPSFITALAAELGVDENDIELTATGGTVTIEITVTATVTDNPSGTESIAALQEIQASLNNATTILVEQLGDPEDGVQTVALDLCSSRDCNGFGDDTAPNTDSNGCNPSTGVCVCTTESNRWGINCESECVCLNGGTCINNYCNCNYPYYGFNCNLNLTDACSTCGL